MTKLILYLFLACFVSSANAEELEWKTVKAWENWFTFRVPSSFEQDPQSFKGEGYKWVVIFNHPDNKFSVSGSPYGYISQIDGENRGFKSPRDIFLVDEIQIGAEVVRKDGYEVFTQHTKSYTQVLFLVTNPDWGMSYRSLFFKYPEGLRVKYKELISKITKSYKPHQVESIIAEQSGAVQPATAPGSKPEGVQKTKPEPEGRSQ
ncbi:hypothetical protein NT6N_38530 [Oceaniferula spumae]|uniref:Uncharacterized protein n=1 Tax=Oceaniferula spumae TaxID=2979115 RepID=A0AAT9FS58_9BACT